MCESRSPCSIGIIFFEGFFEGHKFISFFTVTCLPSLNKGVTLPYLYATPRHGASSNGFYPNLAGFSLPNFAVNALRVALIFTRVPRQNSCFKHETPFFYLPLPSSSSSSVYYPGMTAKIEEYITNRAGGYNLSETTSKQTCHLTIGPKSTLGSSSSWFRQHSV